MASTPEGQRLTEEHRQAQQQVRDDFLAEFIALWVLLDSARLDETGPSWVALVTRLVRAFRRESAAVAAQYFWDFAAAEAPSTPERPRVVWEDAARPETPPPPAGPATGRPPRSASASPRREPRTRRDAERAFDRAVQRSGVRWDFDDSVFERIERRTRIEIEIPELDEDRNDRATEVSLIVTGPVGQKSKIKRGRSEREARDASFVESSGAASSQVLTGGRQSLLRLIEADTRLEGYVRVTDGDPCYFCAMLASRGPVYRTPKRASFSAHNHCACTAEPVYTSDTAWPGRSREFQQLWNRYIRGRYSGDEAIRQWRKIYTELQREARQAEAS